MTRAWTLCLALLPGCEVAMNVRYDNQCLGPGQTVAAEASLTRRID